MTHEPIAPTSKCTTKSELDLVDEIDRGIRDVSGILHVSYLAATCRNDVIPGELASAIYSAYCALERAKESKDRLWALRRKRSPEDPSQ